MTHLAGGVFHYGHWFVQRCTICGKALVKIDLRKIAVPAGQAFSPGCWEPGSLVEEEGNRSLVVGSLNQQFADEDLPPDFCLWDMDMTPE